MEKQEIIKVLRKAITEDLNHVSYTGLVQDVKNFAKEVRVTAEVYNVALMKDVYEEAIKVNEDTPPKQLVNICDKVIADIILYMGIEGQTSFLISHIAKDRPNASIALRLKQTAVMARIINAINEILE